jgi:hypothetical protein
LLDDRAMAAVMAERAQRLVRADYTLERCHERYVSLYREMMR